MSRSPGGKTSITVTGENESWAVTVADSASSRAYTVSLRDDYFKSLSDGVESKASFIRRSFEFLLERESKESILGSFDLGVISNYFPEYEKIIRK